MRKFITSVVLASLAFIPVHIAASTDWSGTIKKTEQSVVYIQVGEDGGCTGFVINQDKHYVMTAGHCANEKVYADLSPARIVALDTHEDLMVLEVKDIDPTRPALKLAAKDPERGQEIMSVGFGYALESAQFRVAHIADNHFRTEGVAQEFFSTDATFVPGQSGGPIVNTDGEVVMIVQRGSDSVGIGIGAETIRQRLGRFFSEK